MALTAPLAMTLRSTTSHWQPRQKQAGEQCLEQIIYLLDCYRAGAGIINKKTCPGSEHILEFNIPMSYMVIVILSLPIAFLLFLFLLSPGIDTVEWNA